MFNMFTAKLTNKNEDHIDDIIHLVLDFKNN